MNSNKVKKGIIYNLVGNFVYLFSLWLITFVVVWISGYELAGILSIAMTVSATFCTIATFNMRNYEASDINGEYSEKTYIKSRLITSLIAVLLTIVYSLIKGFNGVMLYCVITYMIFKINEAITDVLHGSLQKKWKFNIIGISTFMRGIISVSLFSLVLFVTNNLLFALIAMTIGVYVFIIFYDVRKYLKEFPRLGTTNNSKIIKLLITCIPLVIYGIIFNYTVMYVRVNAEKMFGSTLFGYYSSVATPAIVIQVVATYIFTPLIPKFTELYNNKDYKRFNKNMVKIIIAILLFGLVSIIISYFLKDFILVLLFGKSILTYTYLFYGVIMVSTLTAVIWFLAMLLTVKRNYKILIIGSVISLIITFLITKLLLYKQELNGINTILIIVYVIQIIIYLISFFKNKNTDKESRNILISIYNQNEK